eukprot:SAG25_NODE_7322_length_488_cov_0.647815_1_plen_123_part_10
MTYARGHHRIEDQKTHWTASRSSLDSNTCAGQFWTIARNGLLRGGPRKLGMRTTLELSSMLGEPESAFGNICFHIGGTEELNRFSCVCSVRQPCVCILLSCPQTSSGRRSGLRNVVTVCSAES